MKLKSAFAFVVLLASIGSPVCAQQLSGAGMTIDGVVKYLQSRGYPSEVVANEAERVPGDNKDLIKSKALDTNFVIVLLDCKASLCATIQFSAGWSDCPLSVDQINTWNFSRRWIKAYVRGGVCVAQSDAALAFTSSTYLDRTVDTWVYGATLFRSFLGSGTVAANASSAPIDGAGFAALAVGKTKYVAVLNRFGLPLSDSEMPQGGRNVSYRFGQLATVASGPATTGVIGGDAANALVEMVFDRHGVLEKMDWPTGNNGAANGDPATSLNVPAPALNTFRANTPH